MKIRPVLYAAVAASIATLSLNSYAQTKVLVLDTPVDYTHSWINPYIDTTSMDRYFLTDTQLRYASWKELTDFYLSDMKMSMRKGDVGVLLELLDRYSNNQLTASEREKVANEIREGVNSHPEWRQVFDMLGAYLHGTHVAGLTVLGQDPSQIQLITAPVFSRNTFEAFAMNFMRMLLSVGSSRAEQNIAQMTQAMHEQGIKVVNMSFGSGWRKSIEETMKSEIPLFANNPDTVFVVAAGNSATNLSNFIGSNGEIFPQSKVKNVLFVAALDESGQLAEFSDYGVGVVHIGAPGTSILSASPNGKFMHMQGTSMASPIVANRVAKVRSENSLLNAEEAIQFVLDNETHSDPTLSAKITAGRSLNMGSRMPGVREMELKLLNSTIKAIQFGF